MSLALDGSVHGNNTSASLSVSLTTTNSNDVIVVIVTTNGGPVTSVTSAHVTFSKRIAVSVSGSPADAIEEWYGIASSPLSSESITVNLTSGVFNTVDAFGISGANTASPYDPNGSLPATTGSSATDVFITTTDANCFLIGAYRQASTANPTVGSGWTGIGSADYQLSQYLIVSSAQSGLDVVQGGNSTSNAGIGDAIVAAGSGTNVSISAATSSGAAASATPTINPTFPAATATATAAAFSAPNVSINLSAASTTSAVAAIVATLGTSVNLSAATASGAVASPTPSISYTFFGVATTSAGVPFIVPTNANVNLSAASATGSPGTITVATGVNRVVACYSIMQNTTVPSEGGFL